MELFEALITISTLQTISHKCSLLEFAECRAREAEESATEDVYYHAGEYDPVLGTIHFSPGVIR